MQNLHEQAKKTQEINERIFKQVERMCIEDYNMITEFEVVENQEFEAVDNQEFEKSFGFFDFLKSFLEKIL